MLDVANTFAPIATLSTVGAWEVEVNPTTNIVYVTAPNRKQVIVINGQTTTVKTTVATPPGPTDVAIDTTTNDYYVSDGKVNAVSHFNGTTNHLIRSVPVGDAPDRMVYNESTNQLFVSNPLSDTISVIDCATDNVMAKSTRALPTASPAMATRSTSRP